MGVVLRVSVRGVSWYACKVRVVKHKDVRACGVLEWRGCVCVCVARGFGVRAVERKCAFGCSLLRTLFVGA